MKETELEVDYVYRVKDNQADCIFLVTYIELNNQEPDEILCDDLWVSDGNGLSYDWEFYTVYEGIEVTLLCHKDNFQHEYPEYSL